MIISLTNYQTNQSQKIEEVTVTFESTHEKITNWMNKCYPHPFTLTKIGQSDHLRSVKGGFEIEFKEGGVQTVFVYFRTNKVSCFQDPVCMGINKGWNIKGTVSFLGQPPVKNAKLIELIYPHLGLGLVFGGSWSNQSSPIDYCYIFKREDDLICGGCSKKVDKIIFKCICGIVKYCSKECYKRHYGHHLIFCQEGQPM